MTEVLGYLFLSAVLALGVGATVLWLEALASVVRSIREALTPQLTNRDHGLVDERDWARAVTDTAFLLILLGAGLMAAFLVAAAFLR